MKYLKVICLIVFSVILSLTYVGAQVVINYPSTGLSTLNSSILFNVSATHNAYSIGNHSLSIGSSGSIGAGQSSGVRITVDSAREIDSPNYQSRLKWRCRGAKSLR